MISKKLLAVVGSVCLMLVLVAMSFMTACAPKQEAAPPAVETYKIGASLPLNTPFGIEAKKMYELIIPMFNEAGGLVVKGKRYNLEMTIYDDKYTAEGGKANAERLVNEDKVNVIFSLGTTPTLGVVSVTEPAGILVFCCGDAPTLLDPQYKYLWSSMQTYAGLMESSYAYMTKANPQVKTLFSFNVDDAPGYQDAKMNKRIGGIFDLEYVGDVFYPWGTTDFSPMATRVKEFNPDMVTFSGPEPGAEFGVVLKALWESGWRGLRFITMPLQMEPFSEVVTKEQMEGVMCGGIPMADSSNPNEISLQLKKAYIAKYGSWLGTGSQWVMAFYVWVAAVQKANSFEIGDVTAALPNLRCDTDEGIVQVVKRIDQGRLDRYCLVVGHELGIIRDGKLVAADSWSVDDTIAAFEQVYGVSCR
jgi:ABC-type branched-subunit amino acid transport system substrate-binding protein